MPHELIQALADGYTVDTEGRTLLHMASQECHFEAVHDLLQYGVHLHVLTYDGHTPIALAKRTKMTYGGHSPDDVVADQIRFERKRAVVIKLLETHKCQKVSIHLIFQ